MVWSKWELFGARPGVVLKKDEEKSHIAFDLHPGDKEKFPKKKRGKDADSIKKKSCERRPLGEKDLRRDGIIIPKGGRGSREKGVRPPKGTNLDWPDGSRDVREQLVVCYQRGGLPEEKRRRN